MAKGKKTGGRKAGTPNKSTAIVKKALLTAFDKIGGVPALTKWGKANPSEFYKLWARLLPQEVTGEDGGPIVTQTKEQRDAAVAAALAANS